MKTEDAQALLGLLELACVKMATEEVEAANPTHFKASLVVPKATYGSLHRAHKPDSLFISDQLRIEHPLYSLIVSTSDA